MKTIKRFEDWFALRLGDQDDRIWPSRLIYDPIDGIYLDAINFTEWKFGSEGDSAFEAETLTGYLGYQTPATLIDPFVKEFNPGSIGFNFPRARSRYVVVANGIP